MKKKDMKKLAKCILAETRKFENGPKMMKAPDQEIRPNSNPELTERVFKTVMGLFQTRDKISFMMTENVIEISGDMEKFKTRSNSSNKYYEDYISITVSREGFRFSRTGSPSLNFRDPDLFDRLYPHLSEQYVESTIGCLNSMIDDILVTTKISRGSNLDKLLEE